MTLTSVELIPRDAQTLLRDAHEVARLFPDAGMINIPDLLRFPLRSWEAARLVRPIFGRVVPHIRAIDIAPDAPLPGVDDPDLREVLVVKGDPPSDLRHRTYPNSSESVIARYRREAPHLDVYAAFDPYRRAPYKEMEAIARKKEAGAIGFFTQPVFDLPMLELCMNWLHGENVFWGISPVVGPKSRSYWETTNHVIFPHGFEPTLEANVAFARRMMEIVAQAGGNTYLMPLRVNLERYLTPLRRDQGVAN
ncbi:methylenetetrahydrofolate reductase [Komagataeibacter sp. AV436]|uniref:Methylenetetrahydrofolate reductase n=1 Tax=Komagataeibacter melomenusus TaxID=2766578 RepID=A0ABX2AJ91_9PROT|nr:methylenetetrahydrofolate reductase [Komagataeibacter melomenusus]MBV1829587.1 methylenetetrahydrofolate reductase [Komagataeibacter melomenusus]NPC67809.1 methylenetetrahydrofolate reductase [Komagataeibacter melomenusus]